MKDETNVVGEKIINGNSSKIKTSLSIASFNKKMVYKKDSENKIEIVKDETGKNTRIYIGMITFVSLIIFLYFSLCTSYGNVQKLQVNGNYILSKEIILKTITSELEKTSLLLKTRDLEKKINQLPLIEKVEVKRNGLNGLKVLVTEKKIVGCMERDDEYYYVFNNGEVMTDQIAETCQGVVFKGLDSSEESLESLRLFVQSFNQLEDSVKPLIKEVTYDPQYGDSNRFSLFLVDGNMVVVNSYTMNEKFPYYPLLVAQVKNVYGEEANGIFHLDVGNNFKLY